MLSEFLVVSLGVAQGAIALPLTFYFGYLVRRDLSERFSTQRNIVGIVAPLAIMVVWLLMSYLASDSLLDLIANTTDERLHFGRLWALSSFGGLVALAVVFAVRGKTRNSKR